MFNFNCIVFEYITKKTVCKNVAWTKLSESKKNLTINTFLANIFVGQQKL